MKKLSIINESSPWIKPFDRAMAGTVRKEDNLSDIFSVPCKLYVSSDGGKEKHLFSRDEVNDILKKNPGWRLPNLKDIRHIAFDISEYKSKDTFDEMKDENVIIMQVRQRVDKDEATLICGHKELTLPLLGMKGIFGRIVGEGEFSYFWLDDFCNTKDDEYIFHWVLGFGIDPEYEDCDWRDKDLAVTDICRDDCGCQVILLKDTERKV